jgi:uncharacterized protein (TIGR03083 family)
MNATDVMRYGNQTLLRALGELTPDAWELPGACGIWSVKNIVAHLGSYELVLVEVLAAELGSTQPTPLLDAFRDVSGSFNDDQVALRAALGPEATLAEYQQAHHKAMALLAQIAPERLRQPGSLPWYGAEYALDDFIVYAFYGHKREHSAQIDVLRDRLSS